MKKNCRVIPILILGYAIFTEVYAYGEKVDTLPIWEERAVLVLTNACRMAPIEFRDRFLGTSSILLPENYPAVPPLYWNRELNAAARYHCIEMTLSCGLSHSCNGISFSERVKQFYTKSSLLGENIAVGYKTPQQVVNAWLLDKKGATSGPAPDKNGDGHRANIMSSRYKEIGCGYYFLNSDTTQPYWCQDFGGGTSPFYYHPIVAASHLFLEKNKITFFVNLYDPKDSVAELSLLLEGVTYELDLIMGKDTAGTYGITLDLGSTCRAYTIKAVFRNSKVIYYPENGSLLTFGEGDCKGSDYKASVTSIASCYRNSNINIKFVDDKIVSTLYNGSKLPLETKMFDCKGRLSFIYKWNGTKMNIKTSQSFSSGVFIVVHKYQKGISNSSRIPLFNSK
ncbi:MAG: CAP domain-containing protein [Chitinispirillaceae bacterium]|nr:CAP domain-containing protein [Chitinispirillaceae bacterium]